MNTATLTRPAAAAPDLAAIKTRQQAAWSSGDYAVIGSTIPMPTSLITLDGSISGEEHDVPVISNNATIYGITGPTGQKFTASRLVTASGFCQGGDSGGPMYIRQPTPLEVSAVGTLVCYYGLPSGGFACAGERISAETSASNTSLILGANVVS